MCLFRHFLQVDLPTSLKMYPAQIKSHLEANGKLDNFRALKNNSMNWNAAQEKRHSCPSLPPQYTVLQRTILYLLSTGGYDCTLGAIPLYHMGWVGLYQGFMHTHGVHKNPLCLSYPTIPHGMGGSVPGILTYTDWACKS